MLSGRCYCGQIAFTAIKRPQTVAYCHCVDCRRWTGGPVAAFAPDDIIATPDLGQAISVISGVDRWSCPACGSPIAARFDYLPDQIYVPLGLFDQIDELPPETHCHDNQRASWLCIDDTLPREGRSARETLRIARPH